MTNETNFLMKNKTITISDILLLLLVGIVFLFYNYDSNIAPTYLLSVIQLGIFWFILRISFTVFPVLARYTPFIIMLAGLVQAIWGLGQLYNYFPQKHALFKTTGSFFNSGPYGGFIALIFPIVLHYWLHYRNKNRILSYIFIFIGIVCMLVFPATMSRTAWIAAAIGSALVLILETRIVVKLMIIHRKHKKQFALHTLIAAIMIIVSLSSVYYLKKDSANGRLFMWKISALAIKDAPITGVGLGGFPAAYSKSQMEYFKSRKASGIEKLVSGSPEYAFNEYLRIFLEQGVIGGVLFILLTVSIIRRGIINKQTGIVGSFLALSIFAFASYPFYLWEFLIVWVLLGAISVSNKNVTTLFGVPEKRNKISYIASCLLIFILFISAYFVGNIQYKYFNYNKNWEKLRPLYSMKAYDRIEKDYEFLYSKLNYDPKFVFEYGIILNSLDKREKADSILTRGLAISCDPMFYNVKGRNYQEMGEFDKAEESYMNSTFLLPERIYPYYLLTKLYAEPDNYQKDKMHWAANAVLEKEPKVHSTAIKEMRAEVSKILKDNDTTTYGK